jgi:DUF4097 and DUF4098 domain-containing protein YvlB
MNRTCFLGALAALAAFAAAAPTPARADEWTKSYTISGRANLRVETDDGDVSILSGDQKQVDARVSAEGHKIGASDVRIDESQNGDQITLNVRLLRFNWSWWGTRHSSVRIELRVPRELDLDVHTSDGSVSVQPVAGHIRIDTGDGNISANGLKGDVNMHAGDGHIEASGLDGTLNVDTGDGHVTVEGRFDVLNLKTGDGAIEARVKSGSRVASSWRLHSGDGHINLWLPGDLSADLDARTGDGHITMDVPVTVSGSLSHSSIHGKLNGGGGTVAITSGDGSIHVQKL